MKRSGTGEGDRRRRWRGPACSEQADTYPYRLALLATSPASRGRKGPYYLARSTYEPSAVITTILVPVVTKGGTLVRTPLESSAGL